MNLCRSLNVVEYPKMTIYKNFDVDVYAHVAKEKCK